MSDWQRQPGLACEFCGGPGHLIPIAPPISLVFNDTPDTAFEPLETHVTCPEHRFLVKSRAMRQRDEPYFAERLHGRPVLGAETYPDRLRQSIRALYERLGYEVDQP